MFIQDSPRSALQASMEYKSTEAGTIAKLGRAGPGFRFLSNLQWQPIFRVEQLKSGMQREREREG